MPETTVTVTAIAEPKHGQTNGKDWTKWAVKGSDDIWYVTFSEGLGTRFEKGHTYTVVYTEQEGYKDRTIKSIKDALPTIVPSPAASGGDKDRAIIRQVAWKAAATLAAGIFDSDNDPSDVFKAAARLAHGIENDIYRDTPKPEPKEDDDIPF